jgi:tetratricopeptide (TPR) repeat protein
MKKVIVFTTLALFVSVLNVFAQKSKKEEPAQTQPQAPAVETDITIYNSAMKYGDYDAARFALYSLMAKHPENISYLDSLIRIYFMTGNWAQCILTGNEYMKKDTGNVDLMELVAVSNSNLSRNKEALDLYEKLYRKTGHLYHAYQVAVHQYIMQRYGECAQMIDIIVNDTASAKELININAEENQSQQVPIRASALNLRGVMLKEINMPEKAKENFEAALKIAPDFILAKNNIELMKKESEPKQANKTTPDKKPINK